MICNRRTIRLAEYDYSQTGYYFLTICSNNKKNIFGKYNEYVREGLASSHNNIQLSIIGQIIDIQWNDITNKYNNIELDKYIVMPNHIHGILIINKREDARPSPTIFDIICSFKSKCTVEYLKYIKHNNLNISGKIWQRAFYEHVIRNELSLNEIREYIINNPAKWQEDKYYIP
ncbi:MAG: transposase [Candidatus Omnitrophota bacterium]